jgi:hypothetical protein
VQKILDHIRKVEERKSKLARTGQMRNSKNKRNTLKLMIDLNEIEEARSPPVKPVDAVNTIPTGDAFEEGVIEKLIVKLNFEVTKIRNELSGQIDNMTNNLRSSADNNTLLMKQVLYEMSEHSEDRSREKLNIDKELLSVNGKIQELRILIENLEKKTSKIKKNVSFLVEAFQMQQVLDAQDEDDRHSLGQNIDKDLQNELILSIEGKDHYSSVLPSANFLLKKNCLACGQTTSMLAGVRTSVVYHPSPVVYRDKAFSRPELIMIKGKVIDGIKKGKVPCSDQDFSGFFNEITKNSKGSTTREISRFDVGERDLPSLNLGSVRNRSGKRSRFLAKSAVHSVEKYHF